MLIVKSLHIVFMVTWFAGLFYLPRLFVYHALCTPDDRVGIERFKVMERKLYRGIMTPAAVLTIVFGMLAVARLRHHRRLAARQARAGRRSWSAFHVYLGKLVRDFRDDRNPHGHVFYRWLNEIPALPILLGVVFLVVMKPF